MSRYSYNRDPHWLAARRPGPCGCADPAHVIFKGDRIFYYPSTRTAYVGMCAERAAADFTACVQDEETYNGGRY